MALLGSKQLNSRLTGSFTLSGSLAGDSASTGSFGHLNVAGNSNLVGDLTLGGNIQIGDSSGDSITIDADLTSNIIPNADSTYDLGTSVKNWRFGYIEQLVGESLITSGNVSGSFTSTGSFGRVEATKIEATEYIISSSVTNVSIATLSGSTEFGDDSNDNHRFTGSLKVTGSLNVDSGRIFEQGTSVIDHATAMAIVFGG